MDVILKRTLLFLAIICCVIGLAQYAEVRYRVYTAGVAMEEAAEQFKARMAAERAKLAAKNAENERINQYYVSYGRCMRLNDTLTSFSTDPGVKASCKPLLTMADRELLGSK